MTATCLLTLDGYVNTWSKGEAVWMSAPLENPSSPPLSKPKISILWIFC